VATVSTASAETVPTQAGSAEDDAKGQSRTALVSIGAAALLVALKLGTGIVTGARV
jgi:hypothetical protein